MKITVFCGSRFGNSEKYQENAYAIGKEIASQHAELVYGGSTSGTMGSVSQGVLDNGGKVTGIYPQGLFDDELPRANSTTFIETKTMAKRKELLIKSGDAFLILPGGLGTLEELGQLMSDMAIGLIPMKKIGILNTNGYYDHFIKMIDSFVAADFMDAKYRDNLIVDQDYHKIMSELVSDQDSQEISA